MPVNDFCMCEDVPSEVRGRIFSIQRCSVHDGPGMRTVVYMKGCNMRCEWCHNPEGLDVHPQILFHKLRCIGCERCVSVCPMHRTHADLVRHLNTDQCLRCGMCADACPSNALEYSGREYTVEELMNVLMKDADYFRHTGGGVSFSGGECLLQIDFLGRVAEALHAQGLHVLLESALCLPWICVQRASGFADSFYVDVKHMNSDVHREHTGLHNNVILENIRRLCGIRSDVVLRAPLIPGFNDTLENLCATVRFAERVGARGLQLLRYNPLASSKYESAGMQYQSFGMETQTAGCMDSLCSQLNATIGRTQFAFWKA